MNNKKDNHSSRNFIEIAKTNNYGFTQVSTTCYEMHKIQSKLLEYYLYKISCDLKSNGFITGIKLTYINRKDKSKIDVINIPPKKKSSLNQEMIFDSSELIIDIRLWIKERLIGFEIETNKGQIKKFGYGDESQLVKIPELENKENIVVGFEINADDKDGITAICCYYLWKNKFLTYIHSGFFYLKAKLKNDEYKKKIKEKMQNMDKNLQLLYKTCLLPDYQFLQVMKFVNNFFS